MENSVLCRLCAVEKDSYIDGYVYIYSEEGFNLELEKKIIQCLHIELQPSDALPKVVCLDCCSKLRQCADFVESSEAAQARLIGLLGLSIKNEDPCDFPLAPETVIKLEKGDNAPDGLNNSHPQVLSEQGSEAEESDAQSSTYAPEKSSASGGSGNRASCTRTRASNKRKCRLPVRVSLEPQLEDDADEEAGGGGGGAASKGSGAVHDDAEEGDEDDDEDDDLSNADDDDDEDVASPPRKRKTAKRKPPPNVSRRELRAKKKSRDSEKRASDAPRNETEECLEIGVGAEGDADADTDGGHEDASSDPQIIDIDDNSKGAGDNEDTQGKRKRMDFQDYTWMCSDCSEELPSVHALREHHTVVHKQQPRFMCAQCSKVYTKYHGFLSHVRQQHRTYRKFRCDNCGRCFSNHKALESHQMTHAEKRSHTCAVCGKSFRQQSALYVHSRCHLPEEIKNKYACDQCDKRFSTKPNLVTHKRIHTGVRNFTCDQCGKSFVQKGNLDAHILTHSSAKPHICEMCGKGFKTELQLRKHGSVHTGIKPHQCDICGRQFRERGTLREHHRIHTGAMPFSCEFCGKSFRFKGVLTTHRRQHTGERPYSCLECQHHFTNWPNYNKHMKRRHGINTSRQTRPPSGQSDSATGTGTETEAPPEGTEVTVPPTLPQPVHMHNPNEQHMLHQHPLDIQKQMPAVLLSVPEPQPLLHKTHGETDVSLYHGDSGPSRNDVQEPQPLVHKMQQMYPMHSAHTVQSHVHAAHPNVGVHDEAHREMTRERDRTAHFYNPAPGQAVNTNPYLHQSQLQSLHQSIHHSLHQSQLPGLYSLPQLQLDPGHLEMLHSSAQHR